MKIQRWDGQHLIDVAHTDLPTYARDGLYIPCGKPSCNHLWAYAGPDPVPNAQVIENKIKTEVPHM